MLNASWAGVLGPRLFNEVRFQYARDHEPGTANSDNPEADIGQSGARVFLIGRNNFSPRVNTLDRVQVADTLTWASGQHALKAGFDVQFDGIRNDFPAYFSGSYTFRSLASFERGRPSGPGELYRQSFAGPGTTGSETQPDLREYSLFVQDDWKPRSDVTLNLGLRYDQMTTDGSGVRNPDADLSRPPSTPAASRPTATTSDRGSGSRGVRAKSPVRLARRLGTVLRAHPDGHGHGRGREQRREHDFSVLYR